MKELEVALAIAISMLLFSTLCSMVLEAIYRAINLRHDNLQRVLEKIYDKEIVGRLHVLLNQNEQPYSPTSKTDFVQNMLKSLGDKGHTLTTIDFIRGLGETQEGQKLAKALSDKVDVFIGDLANRYEDFGRAASENFKSQSQRYTLIISVVVAFVLNVNIVILSKAFLANAHLTQSIIAQSNVIQDVYLEHTEKLQNLVAAQEAQTLADFKTALDRHSQTLAQIEKLKLPIGHSADDFPYFVGMTPTLGVDSSSEKMGPAQGAQKSPAWFDRVWTIESLVYLITTFISGLLIGLGGPFWFDLVKRLSAVHQLAGALTKQKADDGLDAPKESVLDAIKAFRLSASAATMVQG